MIVVVAVLVVLAGLAAWIVRVAGWRFALQRLGGALLIVVLVTFATTVLLRQVGVDQAQKDALVELGLPPSSQPCVSSLGTGADDGDGAAVRRGSRTRQERLRAVRRLERRTC